MFLSKNFSLSEFTISQTASRLNIDNQPSLAVIENLRYLADNLEIVRSLLKAPILISSGFRCLQLNEAIGSKGTSQHVLGQAVDFTCPGFGTPLDIVKKLKGSDLRYDQIIHEFSSWVHISFSKTQSRKQALVIDNKGTRLFV